MNKIQAIKINSSQNNTYSNQLTCTRAQSFKGSASGAVEEAAKLTTQQEGIIFNTLIQKYLGKVGKFISYLSQTAGEIQNLIIIGLGTAFVAPIFIAYNPISHQDKKTKEYSALRQPISAVIATAVGLGINIPIGKQFRKWASEGKLSMFDMSAKQPADYLKDRYNSIIKNFGHLKPQDQKCLDMVNDGSIRTVEDFKAKFPDAQEFVSRSNESTLNVAAERLLDVNNPEGIRKQTVKEFFIKYFGFEEDIRDKNILNPDLNVKKLREIRAMSFLRVLGFDDYEMDEKKLRTFLNKNIYIDDEIFTDKQRKGVARIVEHHISPEENDKETLILKQLFKVFGIDHHLHHENVNILNMSVEDFLLWMKKQFGNEIANISDEEFIKAHARKMIENAVGKAEKSFKAYDKIQGIMLSLATLPLACGVLNWAYPRIMDKCFPSLSRPDAANQKGGK